MRIAQAGRSGTWTFTTPDGTYRAITSARDVVLTADRELGRWWAGKPIGDLLVHARQQGWTWSRSEDR